MQPIRRLISWEGLRFFFLLGFGRVGEEGFFFLIYFWWGFVPDVFPSEFQNVPQAPNVFPKTFPIAPHFKKFHIVGSTFMYMSCKVGKDGGW